MSAATATRQTTASGVAAARPHLFAPWMLAYALLGVVQQGAAPILLPLSAGPAVNAGLLYGAWSLAGIAAPVLGGWADRRHAHRAMLIGGLLASSVALLVFPLLASPTLRMACAFAAGLGAMGASVVGNMFIVGAAAPAEWEGRIGMLQACVSAGQVAGLMLAGLFAPHPRLAFTGAACCLLAAAPLAWRFAPRPAATPRAEVRAPAVVGGEAATAHRFHHASLRGLARAIRLREGALLPFLAVWLLSYTATNAVASMLPVAVTREHGRPATDASAAYAAGVLLSLALYPRAGRWEARESPWAVMRFGLLGRACVLAAMAPLGWISGAWTVWPLLALFAATQVLWPFLSVSSNTLSIVLSPANRGESVGLLNAASSLGAALGGFAGGVVLRDAGYAGLCVAGLVSVLLAAALLGRVRAMPG